LPNKHKAGNHERRTKCKGSRGGLQAQKCHAVIEPVAEESSNDDSYNGNEVYVAETRRPENISAGLYRSLEENWRRSIDADGPHKGNGIEKHGHWYNGLQADLQKASVATDQGRIIVCMAIANLPHGGVMQLGFSREWAAAPWARGGYSKARRRRH
jgi:hypothetical protein